MKKNVLQIIEETHAVESMKVNGMNAWPFLRHRVYFEILMKEQRYSTKKRTRSAVQLIKNFFYGFQELFKLKKFEYLFFENTNKRILLNNKQFDVYFDAWADKLGRDKSLFIEFCANKYYKKSSVHSKHIISDLPLKFLARLKALFVPVRFEGTEILKEIFKAHGIQFDETKELKVQLGEYRAYRSFFKYIEPKAVFVLSSFSKIPEVMAAKSLNIPVLEAQHGYIGKSHPFYSAVKQFPESYPDYIFGFGAYEQRNIDTLIFKPEQIIPMGGLELEALAKRAVPENLLKLRSKYKLIFCLTMQAMREEEMLGSIEDFAAKNKDVLFVIRPKDRSFKYDAYITENIIVLPEYTIYDVLKISDFNITIFSTTAVEGPVLGAKTIFFNADDFSKQYFNTESIGAYTMEVDDKLSWEILQNINTPEVSYYKNDFLGNVARFNFKELLDRYN